MYLYLYLYMYMYMYTTFSPHLHIHIVFLLHVHLTEKHIHAYLSVSVHPSLERQHLILAGLQRLSAELSQVEASLYRLGAWGSLGLAQIFEPK